MSGQVNKPYPGAAIVQLVSFVPESTCRIDVTATSSTPLLLAGGTNAITFIFQNAGTKTCFVKVGAVGVVAVAPTANAVGGDFPILPGAIVSLSFSLTVGQYVAAICAGSDTTTLYVTQGWGS